MRLRLDTIDLYHVRIPLREPVEIGSAAVQVKEAVVLRLQTSRGTGWGESSIEIDAGDGGESIDRCWDVLCQRLGPAALALGDVEVEGFCDVLDLDADLPGAKAGLEIALWHAAAMARVVPLHALLGGVARPMASALCVGICPTVDELLDRIDRHLAEGYRRVKIRIQPDWDIEPVACLRQRWPDLSLAVDAAGSYCIDDLETFRNLDKYGLAAIERPLPADALGDSARLQAVLSTPICLDASKMDADDVRHVAKRHACRIISLSVQRAGGLTRARQIHDAAQKSGLTCRLETTPDLGIGAAAGLHLATLAGFVHPTDVGSASRWFADDLLEPPIVIDAGGYLHLPDGPGFGYRPSREKIEKHTVRCETLTA